MSFFPEPVLSTRAYDLYEAVRDLPIVSPHGHCDPAWCASDNAFPDPAELLIIPDHYIFRMLYSQGVSLTDLGIGVHRENRDPRAIFRLFAQHWHCFLGTPSREWMEYTLYRTLGVNRALTHHDLQIIHAEELDPPEGRAPVFWKLITNLPVGTHADAVHKLEWYALRWKIETFFRTLKTGCRIEELRLATADRLANCIALCCVVAWRVSWLTMLSRETPEALPAAAFTDDERGVLERSTRESKRKAPRDLDFYVRAVARLGGYLDRTSDAPPGTTVIWRGLSRLADLVEGARIAETSTPATCG
jgi:hypothetical protein